MSLIGGQHHLPQNGNKRDLPDWVTGRARRSKAYGHLMDQVRKADGSICTEKVYSLLMSSGLPAPLLSHIWTAVNQINPGRLTEAEFSVVMALTALAQNGTPTVDLSFLLRLHEAPVPVFGRVSRIDTQNPHQNCTSVVMQSQLAVTTNTNNSDEFQDFQAAVIVPSPISSQTFSSGRGIHVKSTSPSVQNIVGNSPVHVAGRGPSQIKPTAASMNLFATPSNFSPVRLRGTGHTNAVGSRLANYDLGSTIPTLASANSSSSVGLVPNGTYSPHSTEKNAMQSKDALLLGDEDKYSALRALSFDTESPNVFSTPVVIPITSHTAEEGAKNNAASSFSDFGEFQSFVGTQDVRQSTRTHGEAKTTDIMLVPSISQTVISSSKNLDSNIFTMPLTPLSAQSSSIPFNNECNDGEFGDFVSFDSSMGEPLPPPCDNITTGNINKQFSASRISFSSEYFPQESSSVSLSTSCDNSTFQFSSDIHNILESPPGTTTTITTNIINNDSIGPLKTTLIDPMPVCSSVFEGFDCMSPETSSSSSPCDIEQSPKPGRNSQEFDTISFQGYTVPVNDISSPETRSIASLELGTYSSAYDNFGDNNYMRGRDDSIETKSLHLDSLSQSSSPTLRIKNLGLPACDDRNTEFRHATDKYQCFKEELDNERERNSTEWIRCLQSCLRIMCEAARIINTAPSSDVIKEVLNHEKGISYILNLGQVFLVANRIYRSWQTVGGDATIEQLHQSISMAVESFSPFLLTSPNLMGNFSINIEEHEVEENTDSEFLKICGVCLGKPDGDDANFMDYGGKFYHPPCANFWVNEVDSILPCLSSLQ